MEEELGEIMLPRETHRLPGMWMCPDNTPKHTPRNCPHKDSPGPPCVGAGMSIGAGVGVNKCRCRGECECIGGYTWVIADVGMNVSAGVCVGAGVSVGVSAGSELDTCVAKCRDECGNKCRCVLYVSAVQPGMLSRHTYQR